MKRCRMRSRWTEMLFTLNGRPSGIFVIMIAFAVKRNANFTRDLKSRVMGDKDDQVKIEGAWGLGRWPD